MREDYELEAKVVRFIFSTACLFVFSYIVFKALEKLDLQYFNGFGVVAWIVVGGYVVSSYFAENPVRKRNRNG